MSKHTVFVEAPPFAKFSDAEMRRLLDDERLEVLDWRGSVNTPGFVEALATADIAVTGNSLTITDELLESSPTSLIALGTGLDMIDIRRPGAASCFAIRPARTAWPWRNIPALCRLPAQRAAGDNAGGPGRERPDHGR
ncbi:MAG: hypothetical protein ACLSAH_01930 [Bilophila wadsworthia]